MTDKRETADQYRYKSGYTGSVLEKEDRRMFAGFFWVRIFLVIP